MSHSLAYASGVGILAAAAIAWADPSTAPTVTATSATRDPRWSATFAASYATSGPASGAGTTLQFMRTPTPWFAGGAMFDLTRLSEEGIAGENGQPYAFTYQSRFLAVAAQLRAPFWVLTPYAELAGGVSIAPTTRAENVSCQFGAGFTTSTALGLQAAITPRLSAGLRWATRMAAEPGICFAILGPHAPSPDRLHTMGLAVSYNW